MSEADKPVFVDEMPDFQDALQKVTALTQNPAAFEKIVHELEITGELKAMQAAQAQLQPQIEAINAEGQKLNARPAEIEQNIQQKAILWRSIAGGISAFAGGIAAYFAQKKWATKGGIIAAITTTLVAGMAFLFGVNSSLESEKQKASQALQNDAQALQQKEQQLMSQFAAIEEPFLKSMATRMLSEQKTIVTDGNEIKLVSTAKEQNSQDFAKTLAHTPTDAPVVAEPPSATERYNLKPPASTHLSGAEHSKIAANAAAVVGG